MVSWMNLSWDLLWTFQSPRQPGQEPGASASQITTKNKASSWRFQSPCWRIPEMCSYIESALHDLSPDDIPETDTKPNLAPSQTPTHPRFTHNKRTRQQLEETNRKQLQTILCSPAEQLEASLWLQQNKVETEVRCKMNGIYLYAMFSCVDA